MAVITFIFGVILVSAGVVTVLHSFDRRNKCWHDRVFTLAMSIAGSGAFVTGAIGIFKVVTA